MYTFKLLIGAPARPGVLYCVCLCVLRVGARSLALSVCVQFSAAFPRCAANKEKVDKYDI